MRPILDAHGDPTMSPDMLRARTIVVGAAMRMRNLHFILAAAANGSRSDWRWKDEASVAACLKRCAADRHARSRA